MRRVGFAALALLFGSTAAALVLAERYHLGLVGTLVLVLVSGGTLPTVYLTWVSYRDSQQAQEGPRVADFANQLAVAVASQWKAEAAARRLSDPYPLSVRWVAADQSLTDDWQLLVTLASSGAGWPEPPSAGVWGDGPKDLDGEGSDLLQVLKRVPTGRLVVLGNPGAGKTMLMVRLVLDLLAFRQEGGPVPVIASLASWDPAAQELGDWLVTQMVTDHPALAAKVPLGVEGQTRAEALLVAGLILPILDGLDEIPDVVRGSAIARINDAILPSQQVLVTCRTEAYWAASCSTDGSFVPVRGAAAIQLCPLVAADVVSYLQADAGSARAGRWDPVANALSTGRPVGQALTTPLMADLARIIYNPRPDGRVAVVRDPRELCGLAMADKSAVEQLLFDGFIPAVYRVRVDGDRNRFAAHSQRWLAFLASHVEYTIKGTDFAWWQLHRAVPPITFGLGSGFAAGALLGIATGLHAGPLVGAATGLMSALAIGYAVGRHVVSWRRGRHQKPRRRLSLAGVAVGIATGLALGVAFGLSSGLSRGIVAGIDAGWLPGLAGLAAGLTLDLAAAGWTMPEPSRGVRFQFGLSSLLAAACVGIAVGIATGIPYGFLDGAASGCLIGLSAGLAIGLKGVLPPLTAAERPQSVLARDRRAAIRLFLIVGASLGIGVGFGFPLGYGLVIGTAYGMAFGLPVVMLRTAWPSYQLARWWLAIQTRLPWSLMTFLGDAHKSGVLRQAGAVYQFRHKDLQHRLSTISKPARTRL